MIDLSVIVVNWNTKKLLADCLSSVYKLTRDITFEVIVVDNGSEDGSPQMVRKKFPRVILIPNKDNLGFTKANNQGVKIARGRYVMLLNSDTYQIENALGKLVKRADQLSNLGAFGPLLLNTDRSIQQSAGFFPHLPQVFWWMTFLDDLPGGTIFKPYHIDHDSFYQKEQAIDWFTGAALMVPREVIKKIGPLDEKIFMYGEEVDWCYRIRAAGYQIYFTPAARIVHIGRGSQKQIPTRAFIGEYQAIIYFYQKHKSRLSLQIVRFLLKMGAILRIVVFSVLGRKELVRAYVEAFKVA